MRNCILAVLFTSAIALPACAQTTTATPAMTEMTALQSVAQRESGRAAYSPATGVKFKASDNVFVKSALAIDFTYRAATVTLPLYRGLSPKGADVFYIITDSSDFEMAKQMGLNYAPKMAQRRAFSRQNPSRPAPKATLNGRRWQFCRAAWWSTSRWFKTPAAPMTA